MKRTLIVRSVLALFLLLSFAQPGLALYQWTDDKGVLHITDYPPPGKAAPEPKADEPPQPPAPSQPVVQPVPASQAVPPAAPAAPPPMTAPPQAAPSAPAPAAGPAEAAQPMPAAPIPISPPPTAETQPMPVPMPQDAMVPALIAGFLTVFLAVIALFYVYYSLCMFKIAKKLNVEGAWAAWVPVIQFYWPVVGAAGKPAWWIILLLVPLVNFFVMIHLWMCITGNLGRNKWLGLLMLLPVVNLVFLGVLAFSKAD